MRRWSKTAAGMLAVLMLTSQGTGLASDAQEFAAARPNTPWVYAAAGEDGAQYLRGVHVLDEAQVSVLCEAVPAAAGRAQPFSSDGVLLAGTAPAATGQTVRVFSDAGDAQEYTIVVAADVDGSGKWSFAQVCAMAHGISEGFPGPAQKMAADLSADGKATVTDLVLACRLWTGGKPELPAVREPAVQPAEPSAASDPAAVRRARQTVRLVNEIRAETGRRSLRLNAKMNEAAQVRVEEILASDKLSHERPDGRACQTVFEGPQRKGENLASVRGYEDSEVVQAVMRALKNSEGHLKNMCLECYTQMGAAYARNADGVWYACHLFADSGSVVFVDTAAVPARSTDAVSR